MAYQCPLCHLALEQAERTFKCSNNHQFDLAKEGYVNLMPAHHKRSKDPGDNKEMMQARRRFLEGNHYDPMRQKVAQLCRQYLQGTPHRLLDIGCGEGYYTDEVAKTLVEHHPEAKTFGLDISKIAVRFAAKRYPNVKFVSLQAIDSLLQTKRWTVSYASTHHAKPKSWRDALLRMAL